MNGRRRSSFGLFGVLLLALTISGLWPSPAVAQSKQDNALAGFYMEALEKTFADAEKQLVYVLERGNVTQSRQWLDEIQTQSQQLLEHSFPEDAIVQGWIDSAHAASSSALERAARSEARSLVRMLEHRDRFSPGWWESADRAWIKWAEWRKEAATLQLGPNPLMGDDQWPRPGKAWLAAYQQDLKERLAEVDQAVVDQQLTRAESILSEEANKHRWFLQLKLSLSDETAKALQERQNMVSQLRQRTKDEQQLRERLLQLARAQWPDLSAEKVVAKLDEWVEIRRKWSVDPGKASELEPMRTGLQSCMQAVMENQWRGPGRAESLRRWTPVAQHEGLTELLPQFGNVFLSTLRKELRLFQWVLANPHAEPVVVEYDGQARNVPPGAEMEHLFSSSMRVTHHIVVRPVRMQHAYASVEQTVEVEPTDGGRFRKWSVPDFNPLPVLLVGAVGDRGGESPINISYRLATDGEWKNVPPEGAEVPVGSVSIRITRPDYQPVIRNKVITPGDSPVEILLPESFEPGPLLAFLNRMEQAVEAGVVEGEVTTWTSIQRESFYQKLQAMEDPAHRLRAQQMWPALVDLLRRANSDQTSEVTDMLARFRAYPYQVAIFHGWKNYDRPQKLRDEAGVLGRPPSDALLDGVVLNPEAGDPLERDFLRSRFALWRAYLEEKAGPNRGMQRRYAEQFKEMGAAWWDRLPDLSRECFYDAIALEVNEDTRLSFSPSSFERLVHGYLGGRTFPQGYEGISIDDPEITRMECHLNYYARRTSSREHLLMFLNYLEQPGVAENPVRCNHFDALLLLNYFNNVYSGAGWSRFSTSEITPARLGSVFQRLHPTVVDALARRVTTDADASTAISTEARDNTQELVTMLGVMLPPDHPLAVQLRAWRQETPKRSHEFARSELVLKRRWASAEARRKLTTLECLSVYIRGTGESELYVAVAGKATHAVGDELPVLSPSGHPGHIRLTSVYRKSGFPSRPVIFEAEAVSGQVDRGWRLAADSLR